MTNKELQSLLSSYNGDLEIRLLADHKDPIQIFTNEHILLTSDTAYCNDDAPMEEWDSEDGKIELGYGKRYLLFNPIIV